MTSDPRCENIRLVMFANDSSERILVSLPPLHTLLPSLNKRVQVSSSCCNSECAHRTLSPVTPIHGISTSVPWEFVTSTTGWWRKASRADATSPSHPEFREACFESSHCGVGVRVSFSNESTMAGINNCDCDGGGKEHPRMLEPRLKSVPSRSEGSYTFHPGIIWVASIANHSSFMDWSLFKNCNHSVLNSAACASHEDTGRNVMAAMADAANASFSDDALVIGFASPNDTTFTV
mmetsp:Transcript_18259/g.22359  ORF Transcript_18259/g.22359 Transcript_18259/m.22359 type:complete len:235 (-) Transcript_18259:10-714(-)